MTSNINTTGTLAERLAGGELIAILAGIGWDAREDFTVVNPVNGETADVISAVLGAVHVKGEAYGSEHAVVILDTHDSPQAAMNCHTQSCSALRLISLMINTDAAMADAVRNISADPGDTFVV